MRVGKSQTPGSSGITLAPPSGYCEPHTHPFIHRPEQTLQWADRLIFRIGKILRTCRIPTLHHIWGKKSSVPESSFPKVTQKVPG